ncbi:MAG TPA: YbaK/EbsC family protein [Bacteroidales bacterium]|nr:YbaK/EbsC family protein [Bacteroidales bacterium]
MEFEDLKTRLNRLNVEFEIIHHEIPIKSRKDALGYFKIEETVPTLIIKAENVFFALIVSGERTRVDFDVIKNLLGCDQLAMADKNEVYEKLGFKTGQIPLIGHDLQCIVDSRIFQYEFVYGGTGDCHYTLKIKPDDLVKANNVILKFD